LSNGLSLAWKFLIVTNYAPSFDRQQVTRSFAASFPA
jgi:hypothetical protein